MASHREVDKERKLILNRQTSLYKRLSIASQIGGNCVFLRRCYKWCITPKPRRSWPCRGPFCHFCCYDCGWRDFKCYRNKLWRWNKQQCRTPKPSAHRQYDRSAPMWNQYRDFDGSLYPDNNKKHLLETVLWWNRSKGRTRQPWKATG